MEGDGKMKVVHQNLLLPLFSDPSDHTNTLDTKSMVDQTVDMHGVIAQVQLPVMCKTWVLTVKHRWQTCCNKRCYHSLFSSLSLLFLNNTMT